MESTWLSHAKRLQAIASTGHYFCKDEFDRERYEEVADIANAMLADLAGVPITRVPRLVSDFAKGYATPKVGFFVPDRLPALSRGRVVESDIHSAFAFQAGVQRFAMFD